MKTIVALYLGFVSLAALADLPKGEPQSALFITSCNQIVSVVIVVNGKPVLFDRNSGEDAEAIKEYASHSKEPARVYEVGCFKFEDRTSV